MRWFTLDRHLFLLAVVFYGFSMIYSVFLWRRGFRQDNRINYLLLLGGAGLHTLSMLRRGFSLNQCPVTNLYEAIVFVTWTVVAAYLLIGGLSRLRFLGAFISPLLFCAGVCALMPRLDATHGWTEGKENVLVSIHAALLLLAYGAFGLSSAAALMYLTQERDLKFHKLRALISRLPPLERLELVVSRLLCAGFILLTAGLALGGVYLASLPGTHGSAYTSDPKIIWSTLIWGVYLFLLVMRWKFAQGGRKFAWGAIGTFIFILLTFWGVSLLSPLHNP